MEHLERDMVDSPVMMLIRQSKIKHMHSIIDPYTEARSRYPVWGEVLHPCCMSIRVALAETVVQGIKDPR